jgi:hypothetical protein
VHTPSGVAHRARGSERCRLDDVPNPDAGSGAIAEHFFDTTGLIVEAQDDLVDLRYLLDEIQLVVQKWAIEDRNDLLRCINGKRPQPRALSPDEKKRLHIEA